MRILAGAFALAAVFALVTLSPTHASADWYRGGPMYGHMQVPQYGHNFYRDHSYDRRPDQRAHFRRDDRGPYKRHW